jgi:hypothetical protein
MPTFALILIIYFLFVAITSQPAGTSGPILSFYELQLQFIRNQPFIFTFLFIVVALLFRGGNKKRNLTDRLFNLGSRLITVIAFASVASLLIIFTVAFIHLNALSILSHIDLKRTGVLLNAADIENRLLQLGKPPKVIFKEARSVIRSAAVDQSGKGFYGGVVISSFPALLIFPEKDYEAGVLLSGDTLIVTDINSPEFQLVSPVVAYSMIANYFPAQQVRSFPQVSVMDKNEYLVFREGNISDKLETIDELLEVIAETVEVLEITVEEEERQTAEKEESVKQERLEREREFGRCVNEGFYDSGTYRRVNSREYCLESVAYRDETIKQTNREIKELALLNDGNRKRLAGYREYLKFYQNQKLLTYEETDFTTLEYAVFNPPNIINITQIKQNSPQAMADYFVVLVHEYLHYTTYNEEGRRLDSLFFEEGLTEYFARKIVLKYLGYETNLAYPVNVGVISQMAKRINETDLAVMYFSGDRANLERSVDRAYGDGFYSENIIFLETIQYTVSTKQILDLANKVMETLGGELLVEDDVRVKTETFRN